MKFVVLLVDYVDGISWNGLTDKTMYRLVWDRTP